MLKYKTYTCIKCGIKFAKSMGGVVASPGEMELSIHPICVKCKLKTVVGIFQQRKRKSYDR